MWPWPCHNIRHSQWINDLEEHPDQELLFDIIGPFKLVF